MWRMMCLHDQFKYMHGGYKSDVYVLHIHTDTHFSLFIILENIIVVIYVLCCDRSIYLKIMTESI